MAYNNNHYVPQFILRRFSEQLCTYNVRTKEYQTNQNTSVIFSNQEFYPVEIEKDFNRLIESPFASILNGKILKSKARCEIDLTRKEVNIIKKFLLLEQFRVFNINTVLSQNPKTASLICPFKEKVIEQETTQDRRLFEKNISPKLPVIYGKPVFKDTDLFRYKIHSMKHEDIILVNMLMLDRIDTFLGFTSAQNVYESVNAYMEWHKQRNIPPRNDYSTLLNHF